MKKTHNILMVCPQFKPLVGGYERAAERLSEELASNGHNVTIVTERRDKEWLKCEPLGGAHIYRYWCVYKPGLHLITSLLSFFVYLLFNLKKNQIIHIHQYGYHSALAIIFAKMYSCPVILKLTNTGDQGISASLKLKNRVSAYILNYLHLKLDAYIVTSNAAYEEAIAFGISSERIFEIGNGIEIEKYSRCSLEKKQLLKISLGIKEELIVTYVGRLSGEKNPIGLIRAWKIITNKNPGARLLIVGDGGLKKELMDFLDQSKCSDSVTLLGSRDNISDWFKITDIYALPSMHEGLSNSLLEAMSSALPIVSTRVSGSTDMFSKGDVGELVDVGNMEDFAKGISSLLADPERRVFCGNNARKIIVEEYSIVSTARAVSILYDKLDRNR